MSELQFSLDDYTKEEIIFGLLRTSENRGSLKTDWTVAWDMP